MAMVMEKVSTQAHVIPVVNEPLKRSQVKGQTSIGRGEKTPKKKKKLKKKNPLKIESHESVTTIINF